MRKTAILTVFGALAWCHANAMQQDIATGQPITFSTKIVPREQFSEETLSAIAEQDAASQPGLLVIWYFVSKQDASEFGSRVIIPGQSYESWIREYRWLTSRGWNVARLIAWRGSAVLQIRDETGRVSRRVIRGTDFLKIEEKGVSIEIVELGERAPTFQGQLPDLLIYAITSSPLDARTAQSIWTRLSDVRARGISIDLRQDPWFIHDDSAVLLFNAFDTIPRAPTLEESRRVRRLSCIGPPSEPRPSCLLHLGANPAGDGAEKATGPSARKPQ